MIKTKTRRILSIFLSMAMLIGILPTATFAADSEPKVVYVTTPYKNASGTGTESDPFNAMNLALAALGQAGGTIHLIDSEIPTLGMMEGNTGFAYGEANKESVALPLPKGNITVDGHGKRLSFNGGLILNGNLTIKNAELYVMGSLKQGYERRIYCNGYDLTIENCTIGNRTTSSAVDINGLVILAGGYKTNVEVSGAQNIRINSGRISAIYAGGEKGKVTGNVNIEITAPQDGQQTQDLEFSPQSIFHLAGIYAQGLDSTDESVPKLKDDTELVGALTVSLNGKMLGFDVYKGNGNANSTFKMANSGSGWREPNYSGFPKLEFTKVEIDADLTDVTDVALNDGAVLRPKTDSKVTLKRLTGNGGELRLAAGKQIAVTDSFTGELTLKLEGKQATVGETKTYLTAKKGATGKLILGGNAIEPVELDEKLQWKVESVIPPVDKMETSITKSGFQGPEAIEEISLPEGRYRKGDDGYIQTTITVSCWNGEAVIQDLPYRADLSGEQYTQSLIAKQFNNQKFWFNLEENGTNMLIPAGEMTVIGSVEAGGVVYSESKTIKMIVEPTIDFHIERRGEGDFFVPMLKGATSFKGTISLNGAETSITEGTSVEISAANMRGDVTAKFTPTDTVYYREATATRNVDLAPQITFTQITESGKKLADAALTTTKGTVEWVAQDGSKLEDTTPILWGETYRWKCTPSEGAAPIYGSFKLGEGEEPAPPIVKKTPTGTPTFTKITSAGKTLADAPLTGAFKDGEKAVEGALAWNDAKSTAVTQGTKYKWTFKPTDAERYNEATGEAVVWENSTPAPLPPSGGGGGGGGAPMPVPPPPAEKVPEVEVTIPKGETSVEVTVPTEKKPSMGSVAVLVNADGTRTIVKNSVATDEGIVFTATVDGKYEIIDNTKEFEDVVADDWYKQAVDYVSARELFAGVDGGRNFEPWNTMTRGMIVTVLHRFEGGDIKAGDGIWYEPGKEWAMKNGLSDGSAMEQELTREQLVTILYRYVGSPKSAHDISAFSDKEAISDYATEAMRWAVERGLLSGRNGASLEPQSNATRAEVAAVLMRFIQNQNN